MRYDEFEKEFPEVLKAANPATVRSWKSRGTVPESVANQARALHSPVAKVPVGVARVDSVAKSVANPVAEVVATDMGVAKVLVPSAEKGHPEFDIMDDGWARGFPCDVLIPSNRPYRTAHAIRRFAELGDSPIDQTKAWTKEFWEKHSQDAESRVAFFKKLAKGVSK